MVVKKVEEEKEVEKVEEVKVGVTVVDMVEDTVVASNRNSVR